MKMCPAWFDTNQLINMTVTNFKKSKVEDRKETVAQDEVEEVAENHI